MSSIPFDIEGVLSEPEGFWRDVSPLHKFGDGPLLLPDVPWEREIYTFGTLMRDGGIYRCWYQVLNRGVPDRTIETAVGYAESDDLISWRKPRQGQYIAGFGRTNLLLLSSGRTDLCSPSVVRVPDKMFPYRMAFFDAILDPEVAFEFGNSNLRIDGWRPIAGEGIFIARSRDGISWERKPLPVIAEPCDVVSLVCLPDGRLLMTFKTSKSESRHFRIISASISADLGETWSDPAVILRPDLEDPAGTEFYGLTPFVRLGKVYGFLQVYRNTPDDKKMEVQLVHANSPSDPLSPWKRAISRAAVLRLGVRGSWDGSRIYPGSPVVTEEGSIILPYGGANTNHDDRRYIRRAIGFACSESPSFAVAKTDFRGGSIRVTSETDYIDVVISVLTGNPITKSFSHHGYELPIKIISDNDSYNLVVPCNGLGYLGFRSAVAENGKIVSLVC